jgi:hypothetical protein
MNESKLRSVTIRWSPHTDRGVTVLSEHERSRHRGLLTMPQRHTVCSGDPSLVPPWIVNVCH